MVVTYYIKLFRTGADRHNGILMSLLLLVAETIKIVLYTLVFIVAMEISVIIYRKALALILLMKED